MKIPSKRYRRNHMHSFVATQINGCKAYIRTILIKISQHKFFSFVQNHVLVQDSAFVVVYFFPLQGVRSMGNVVFLASRNLAISILRVSSLIVYLTWNVKSGIVFIVFHGSTGALRRALN